MEIYCSVDCFPPELKRCLGVKYHCSLFLCNQMNHSLWDSIVIVGVRRTELDGCTMCGQTFPELLIVESPTDPVAPKLLDVVSSGVNLGLLVLIGGYASLLFLIRKEVYGGPSGAVVNQYDIMQMTTFSRYSEWTAGIRVYKLEW